MGFNSKNADIDNRNEEFIQMATIFELTPEVVQNTIYIRKARRIKTPDAIIAATAITYKLTLLSRNINDFINIAGLSVIDPHIN